MRQPYGLLDELAKLPPFHGGDYGFEPRTGYYG